MVTTVIKRFGLPSILVALALFCMPQPAFAQASTPPPTVTPITPVPTETPLNSEKLFDMVNKTRTDASLPVLQRDSRVCQFVADRAPQLQAEISGGYMHAGFWNKNFPYWATENMIYMNTEEQALTWWLNSYVHRSAIYGNYTHGCSACAGKACALIFTSFVPKGATPAATLVQK